MTSLINSHIRKLKLKIKKIKILSSNGIDENNAIVLNTYYQRNREKLLEYFKKHYSDNRNKILEKKKERNKQPNVKLHNSIYHKAYYQDHKEELKQKHREYLRNKPS
jgi:hypothetical protein